ncbi:26S proteasome non-ATPase regulatory subunit 5 [Gamsiella multidivaricata]|nr:26S proteasome non-ATPase regulatory subunit 5 [Gamsiella multidivaricata]
MPSVDAPTANNSSNPSQLEAIISTFTSLTDPLAINDALLVLNHALQGTNSAEVTQRILESIPLAHFFQLLQTDHGDETEFMIDRTCNVLESLLSQQPYSTIVQDPLMSGALLQALSSPSPKVHILGLSQVDKVAKEDLSVLRSILTSDVFKASVEGIASDNISIAERSKQTLLKICNDQERLEEVIKSDASLSMIRDLVHSRSSLVQLRMIEALTELAGRSHESLAVLEAAGLLDALKTGLSATDILTRFNIIEILSELGATTAGSEFLDSSGILTRIAAVVQDETNEDHLGMNAIAKLYGKLGASDKVDFVTLDMRYQILSQLERLMIGDDDFEPDETLKIEAMASMGLIGGNVQNVEWFSQSHCAEAFIDRLSLLPRDSKVAWYHSFAQILACSPDPSPETERIVAGLYDKMDGPGQSPFILRLLVSAKSQTVELSLAALSAMIVLARYPFAVQVAKHQVIEAMLKTFHEVKNTSNIELLTMEQATRLDLIRRQGPFYQRATATVAIQDMAA